MARNFTRELLKAIKPGQNRIVYSSAPYEGRAVEYSPRNKHDASPWILAQDVDGHSRRGFRFNGRECRVQTFRFAVVEHQNRFYVLDTKNGGPQFAGASGPLAVGKAYTSRYAATDAAKRLEQDGPLARVDLTPEQVIDLAISSARTCGQTGTHIVAPKGSGWVVIDSEAKALADHSTFPTRESAQRTARHLDKLLADFDAYTNRKGN